MGWYQCFGFSHTRSTTSAASTIPFTKWVRLHEEFHDKLRDQLHSFHSRLSLEARMYLSHPFPSTSYPNHAYKNQHDAAYRTGFLPSILSTVPNVPYRLDYFLIPHSTLLSPSSELTTHHRNCSYPRSRSQNTAPFPRSYLGVRPWKPSPNDQRGRKVLS